ncbi:MAG: hypothetical protein RLP44_06040 [Aggregatilineales bacterium]
MLDDLRRDVNDGDDFFDDSDDDFEDVVSDNSSTLFLGMTPVERMFLSIFLFMNVTVLGLALLLATGRIG